MDGAATEFDAIDEATIFLRYFKDMPDHRQKGKVVYPLEEILLLCLLAVLAGAETFVDIARFGDKKLNLLRRFRPFRDGTPAHDHLGDIFATLDAQAFQRCFVAWVAALTKTPADIIAIDGKTLRRSYQKKGSKEPIHMVSAFAARQRLVLGQVKVGHIPGTRYDNAKTVCLIKMWRAHKARVPADEDEILAWLTEGAKQNRLFNHARRKIVRRLPGQLVT